MEQIVTPDTDWDETAPIGHGIPERSFGTPSNTSQNLLNAIAKISYRGYFSTGFLVRFALQHSRARNASDKGVCDELSGSLLRGKPVDSIVCLITCRHVLPTISRAEKSSVTVGNYKDGLNLPIVLNPSLFYFTNSCLDLCCCAVLANQPLQTLTPGKSVGTIPRSVFLLHHPNGTVITRSTGVIFDRTDHCLIHTADTLPGSSGGAIFAGRKVIAVHCRAVHVRGRPMNMGCIIDVIVLTMERLGYQPA